MRRATILIAVILLAVFATIPAPVAAQDGPSDETLGFGELWENFYVFVSLSVAVVFLLGLISRSMAVGSFGAYLAFAFLAVETGDSLMEAVMYATLVVVIAGLGFKLWRLEGAGS